MMMQKFALILGGYGALRRKQEKRPRGNGQLGEGRGISNQITRSEKIAKIFFHLYLSLSPLSWPQGSTPRTPHRLAGVLDVELQPQPSLSRVISEEPCQAAQAGLELSLQSEVQASLLPQPPKQLESHSCTTWLGLSQNIFQILGIDFHGITQPPCFCSSAPHQENSNWKSWPLYWQYSQVREDTGVQRE